MKNAGELFEYWALSLTSNFEDDTMSFNGFKSALTEYNSELISEIEKKMEKEAQQKSKQNRVFHQGRYDLLTEIINLIKEK